MGVGVRRPQLYLQYIHYSAVKYNAMKHNAMLSVEDVNPEKLPQINYTKQLSLPLNKCCKDSVLA